MAKPYSGDLRERVAAAIAGGESSRAIAERFEIAPSTVVKWSKRVRETGTPAPAKFGGYRKCSLDPHRSFVSGGLRLRHVSLDGSRVRQRRFASPAMTSSMATIR